MVIAGETVPSQRPNMSPVRLLLMMAIPFLKGPSSTVSCRQPPTRHAALPCPVPWMPPSSSTMGQTQLCQPGRRPGVPCVDHADAMHTDD